MRAPLVVLLTALAVLLAGCPDRVDPEVQAACDQVLELEQAVLDLFNAPPDDPDVLGEHAGRITRENRELRELAEEADHEALTAHAEALQSAMPAIAMSLIADGDPRAAASAAARVVVRMRGECAEAGALD